MAKLVKIDIKPAKNVVFGYRLDDEDRTFECGISLPYAKRGYMIPQYIIIGLFDNGHVIMAGIRSLKEIKELSDINAEDSNVFLFTDFVDFVRHGTARAFVNGLIEEEHISESEAKRVVYKDMKQAGVKMTKVAEFYLLKEYLLDKESFELEDIDTQLIRELFK